MVGTPDNPVMNDGAGDDLAPHRRIMMNIQNERKPHISISQLTDYLNCPYAYYLHNVAGIAWKFMPSTVAFGACIHRTIATMNTHIRYGYHTSKDNVVGQFTDQWGDEIQKKNIHWSKPEEPAELLIKGEKLMELHWKRFHRRRYDEVELGFRLPLLDPATGMYVPQREVVGILDAVSDGALVEYKTSSRTPNQAMVDSDLQLTLYSWAYRMLYGVPEDKIIVVYLVKTKRPKIQVVETHRNDDDYTKLICLMEQVIKAIDAGFFYPNPIGGFGCGLCQYKVECKDWSN